MMEIAAHTAPVVGVMPKVVEIVGKMTFAAAVKLLTIEVAEEYVISEGFGVL